MFLISLYVISAWREKLEQAEKRKKEEAKELQVTDCHGGVMLLHL